MRSYALLRHSQGEVSSGRESLEARCAFRYIWGFIFPFGVRRKNARTRRNRYSQADADWFSDLRCLKIKQKAIQGASILGQQRSL